MSTVTVQVGKDKHEVETKPLTLVFKGRDLTEQISYEGYARLEPEYCLYHAERTSSFDPRTPEMVAKVFEIEAAKVTPDWVRTQDKAVQHVAGRIDMTLKFMARNVKFVWANPEAYLHPGHQCELGDVVIRLSKMEG